MLQYQCVPSDLREAPSGDHVPMPSKPERWRLRTICLLLLGTDAGSVLKDPVEVESTYF